MVNNQELRKIILFNMKRLFPPKYRDKKLITRKCRLLSLALHKLNERLALQPYISYELTKSPHNHERGPKISFNKQDIPFTWTTNTHQGLDSSRTMRSWY